MLNFGWLAASAAFALLLLIDISKDKIKIQGLPKAPKGKKIKDVELIAHLIDN